MPLRSPAGASHSIHHEVDSRSLCALIHHDVRDRRRATKYWSWLTLCCARLAGTTHLMSSRRGFSVRRWPRHSHLTSTHCGFFVSGDPGTPELPRNPGDGRNPENPVFSSTRARKEQFCHHAFLPLSYRALWQEVDVVHVGLKTERRLDVVTFTPSEPSESEKSISLSKVSENSNDRLVYHLLHVDQSDGDEVTR